MNHFHKMIQEPDEDIYDDDSSHRERRLLTIGLYLSYLACLAGLLLIGNVLGQAHAIFPDILGLAQKSEGMRLALLIAPLLVLCACYIRLRRMTGKMMQLPERKLDERQRLVRDRAHRVAYRIITLLCLVILAYVCLHSLLLSASPPPTPVSSQTAYVQPVFIDIVQGDAPHLTLYQAAHEIVWVSIPAPQQALAYDMVGVQQSTPVVSAMPADLLGLGLFYGLFLLIMALIVKTLPTAIIGWKERG
jgi:hypothetical protein